ncbi:MAG: hypothetical protein DLM64_13675 [Solirubrobacterales bacterium]|nr:MAG: hypothetical protein DLM64_13675 [Solirubrobacterales bacterium]
MVHHHYHHRSGGGCLAAFLAMVVAGGVVWVFEHGWPYLLGALGLFVVVAMVRGASRAGAAKDTPAVQQAAAMPPIDDQRRALRMTDAEREQVAQALRAAGADGRLSISELDERLSSAYAARSWGDAAPLLEDLGAVR